MAIANYTSYKSKLENPFQTIQTVKNNFATVMGRIHSCWTVAPDQGNVPSIAVAPDNSTAGSFKQLGLAGVQRLAQVTCSLSISGGAMIADRLSHQGGLSAVVATPQTTNLPTAPLTRYTSGEGVFMALEIYSVIGTTATTAMATYTNSQGVTGRISESIIFGGTSFREAGRLLIMPLQQGDTGVRSVESVTVLATTGTAGNFGVTLFKPLMMLPVLSIGSNQLHMDSILALSGNMPQIENNACLQWMITSSTGASGIWISSVKIIHE